MERLKGTDEKLRVKRNLLKATGKMVRYKSTGIKELVKRYGLSGTF